MAAFKVDQNWVDLIEKIYSEQYDDVSELTYDLKEISSRAEHIRKKMAERVTSKKTEIDIIATPWVEVEKIFDDVWLFVGGELSINVKRNYWNGGIELFDIQILEHQTKTASGMPCNIQRKIDPNRDQRFSGFGWISKFNRNSGIGLSRKETIEAVKLIKMIHKCAGLL